MLNLLGPGRAYRPTTNHMKKGQKMSKALKAKISAARAGQPAWNKGKKWSKEVKAKISKSRAGIKPWNKGKHWSKEVKEKISKSKKQSTKP